MKLKLTIFFSTFIMITSCFSQVSWENLNLPVSHGSETVFISEGRIFTGGFWDESLLYREIDGSEWISPGWSNTNNGLVGMCVHNNYLYALCNSSLYRSNDNGDSWENLTSNLPVTDFAEDITSIGDVLYASFFGQGIFRSMDNGTTWVNINNNFNVPENALNNYNITYDVNMGIFICGLGAVSVSTDNGETFENILNNTNLSYNDVGILNGTIFVAINEEGVIKSTDNGATWTNVNTIDAAKKLYIVGNRIFVGGISDLMYSDDLGATWTSIYDSVLGEFVHGIFSDGTTIYVNTFYNGLFKGENALSTNEDLDIPDQNVTLYPNPATNQLSIRSDINNIISFEIFNSLGQTVKTIYEKNSKVEIDITDLLPGVYFARMNTSENSQYVSQFVKK